MVPAAIALALVLISGTAARADGIVADPSAPANQHPTLLQAGNGVPQVNIQTPSAAGVSRNTYSRFDVSQQGAILNNSRNNVQTRLGGWVQGNPWLAGGTARVILNEVNSSNPSLLQGYIEVAGSQAQVVVANPAGVTCDGCGFINANRATLTTGSAIMNGGNLQGYLVQRGTVTVQGGGMDAGSADYTDIIARAVQVNADIWANDLRITAGTNQVDSAHIQATSIAESGTARAFAVDVAQLGGMYAGKITLTGTEAGVGVRNAGHIGASSGDIVITADGRLENAGSITGATHANLAFIDTINNSGNIYAQGNTSLTTQGDIANSGLIAAFGNTALTANGNSSHIDGTMASVIAAGLKSDGTLGTSGNLTLGASQGITTRGQNLAAENQTLTARSLDLVGSQSIGRNLTLTASDGNLNAANSTVAASGTLNVNTSQTLAVNNAHISAYQLNIAAHNISNVAGEILQTGAAATDIQAGTQLDNSSGTIASNGNTTLTVGGLVNRQGQITAGKTLDVTTTQGIDNQQGLLASSQALTASAATLDNTGGTIASVQTSVYLTATAGAINNTLGKIAAAQALHASSHGMDNTDGSLQGGTVAIDSQSQTFNNTRGTVISTTSLDLQSGAFNNDTGLLQSGGNLTLGTHGQMLTNSNSKGILSQGTITLIAGDLNNQTGQIQALGDIGIDTGGIDNRTGLLRSGQTQSIKAGSIDNRNTQTTDQGIEGQSVAIDAHVLNNTSGAIRANDALTLTGNDGLNNTQGLISSGNTLSITDRVATSGSNVAGKTLAVTNSGGTLIAQSNLTIDSASLSGDGQVLSKGDLGVKLISDYTHTGTFQAEGSANLKTTGALTNAARMQAGNFLMLTAAAIDNQANGAISATTLHLSATDSHTMTNHGLIDGLDTFIDTVTLNNLGTGRIYGDHVTISATSLTNDVENGTAAVIAARNRLDIGATTITNREHALLFSAGDLNIGGSLDASHQTTGQVATLNNNSASIEALGNLDIVTATLDNTNEHFATAIVLTTQNTFTGWNTGEWCSSLYSMPGCTGNFYEDHTEHSYIQSVYAPVVTQSDPAKITANGSLSLHGSTLTNDKSQVIAGGDLTCDLGNIVNVGAQGTQQTILTDHYRVWMGGGDDYYRDIGTHVITTNAAITLPVATVQSHTSPTGSGIQIAALTTGSVNQSASGAGTAQVTIGNGQTVSPVTQVAVVGSVNAAGTVIRTTFPNATLPNNSLFHTNPNASGHYLIETDPRFTNFSSWISSDYMLTQLGLDPALIQKRLGDGFYEQQLVREQVAELTGRRFLDGYARDEAEYRDLIDSGIAAAQAVNLIPGVALTETQMAQLTSDIVWLVEKTVAFPDGTTQQVLVPQLYVRLKDGDLDGSGTLLAGNNVQFDLTGDLTNNNGTIAGRSVLALTADNIQNLNGRIMGNSTSIDARTDLDSIGGRIESGDLLAVNAGRDINIETTTATADNVTANTRFTRTTVDRVAGLYVSNPNGILVASAGNDLNFLAAEVVNNGAGGQTTLVAERDLSLSTITEAQVNSQTWDARNYGHLNSTREIGTTLRTSGDLTLIASRDLTARAANVTGAQGALVTLAGNNLTIETGAATRTEDTAHYGRKSGFLSSTTKTTHDTLDETTAIASTFSGDTADLQAGNNLSIKASNVVGTNDVNLGAVNNVTIESAQQTHDETHLYQKSKSGVFASVDSLTIGNQSLGTTNDSQQVTNLASTIGSVTGDVNISAGKTYAQTGSNVLAPQGDIGIAAQRVGINAATDTYAAQQTMQFKQSGLSVSISNPIINTVQTANQMKDASTQTTDPRMQSLAAATVALSTKNAYDMLQPGSRNPAAQVGGINISASLGSSKSSNQSRLNSSTTVSSTVAAGRDVSIISTGASEESSINVVGSDISAGRDTTLIADSQINLLAVQNNAIQQSSNKSSSASVGMSMGTNGFAVMASVSKGKGKTDSTIITYTNTQLAAGNVLVLKSGTDTTLRGATATGKQVVADIGTSGQGNLNIESLQDTSAYTNKQSSTSFNVSVPISPGNYGGSINASRTNINNDYASVTEQSAIKAGDNGFDIHVTGNTDLEGAVIASSDKAIKDNMNSLTTKTLTVSDIQNKAEYTANVKSLNVGGGIQGGIPTLSGAGIGSNSGEASSLTVGGISRGTVNISDNTAQQTIASQGAVTTVALLNRDVIINDNGETVDSQGHSTAHTIRPIFDQNKVELEIQAQVQITQAFSQQAPRALSTFALDKTKPYQDAKDYEQIRNQQESNFQLSDYEISRLAELESTGITKEKAEATLNDPQAKRDYENWNTKGNYRLASNIIIATMSGDIPGATAAVTKESLSWAADEMRQAMIEDSMKFPGICANENDCISNISGKSVGMNRDGIKVAGSRIVLSDWCDQGRCMKDSSTRSGYKENSNGTVIFNPGKDEQGNELTIKQFVEKYNAQYELRSPLGGIQGGNGQMQVLGIRFDYATNSFWDKLAEAYSGTHDTFNSIIWYDNLGNGKDLNASILGRIGSIANIVNVGLSTPFALSVLLPPEVWNAVFSLTKIKH